MTRPIQDVQLEEPIHFKDFRSWLNKNGAYIHPTVSFVKNASGSTVICNQSTPADTTIMTCPFSLAVTPTVARNAIQGILKTGRASLREMDEEILTWNEPMLLRAYLVLHWIAEAEGTLEKYPKLRHIRYLRTFPPPELLSTPLYFTPSELLLLKGTNLYGFTQDREQQWRNEYQQSITPFTSVDGIHQGFTWERYLRAVTCLTSRAFPSRVLSRDPATIISDDQTVHPVLIPGIDAMNHKRGHQVSWVVSHAPTNSNPNGESGELHLTFVHHGPLSAGEEIFNNYGPKPNAELISGYGFAQHHNPDDTIVLQLGGGGQKWEVGRAEVCGTSEVLDGLWNEILLRITLASNDDDMEEGAAELWEFQMDAANALLEMANAKIAQLPSLPSASTDPSVRENVRWMIECYVQGQKDILQGVVAFARDKLQSAILAAKESGVDIVVDDEDEAD